jgi:hypothetical protein
MSILRRYSIKYESDSLRNYTLNNIKTNIEKIYNQVKISFPEDDNQHLVLTGSSALFMYLHALGYNDLIDKLDKPSDVDLLIVLNSKKFKMKPFFNILYVGDYQRINKDSKEPDDFTLKSSVTFKNKWTSDKINEFDLTYVFSTDLNYNQINNLKLIKLEDILSFYQADLSLPDRSKDRKKIEIIEEINKRLKESPQPDLIINVPKFQEIKLSNLSKLTSIKRTLFE